nr:hypothetical protein [Tanacetum cinerariifolium]
TDDVLEETIAKDASEVVAEKERKKQKRKVVGDASGSTYPPKKLRDDHHPSRATEPLIAAFVALCWTLRFRVLANLRTFPPHVRFVVSSYGSRHSGSYVLGLGMLTSGMALCLRGMGVGGVTIPGVGLAPWRWPPH